MKAMRTGAIASMTPFRYSRLLFSMLLGVVVLSEKLRLELLAGSAIIVLSGALIARDARHRQGRQ